MDRRTAFLCAAGRRTGPRRLRAGHATAAHPISNGPGTWQAEGVNDRNLRAMVADPSHLARGVGAATDRGAAGAAAVIALECGMRPPLPRTS